MSQAFVATSFQIQMNYTRSVNCTFPLTVYNPWSSQALTFVEIFFSNRRLDASYSVILVTAM